MPSHRDSGDGPARSDEVPARDRQGRERGVTAMVSDELRHSLRRIGRGASNDDATWAPRARSAGEQALPRTERRDHSRYAAHVIFEIRGRVRGSRIRELRGVTVDMSRGGALVVFAEHVAPDPANDFLVRFVNAAGKVIAPEFRWGNVLRSQRLRSDCVAAVKFQRALPHDVLHRLLSADLAPALRAHA